MIGLRIVLILLALSFTSTAHGEAKVYTGLNVYKQTVSLWEKAVQDASFDSITWIWNLGTPDRKHKNGSRDTILMVPSTAVPDDITLVVWFHGLSGFRKGTFEKRIIPQVEDVVGDGHSIAIAIPEMPWSINTSTPRKRQGQVWKRPGSLTRYVDSLREHLEAWAVVTHGVGLGTVRIVFVGHSAGGSALMSVAKEGSLCNLKPEAIIFSDASYGYWLDRAWSGCIKDTNTELHILVRKWDKPHQNAQRVIKRVNRRRTIPKANIHYQILNRKQWSHSKIGNSVFTLTNLFPPGC